MGELLGEIWTEKYRPKTFEEVKGQDKIIERIKAMVKNKNIQNMIFAGPSGTGKTTVALIIAKQLYKQDWNQNFLELNASDDRGINIVRSKIKDFSRTRAIGMGIQKLILLDEADALTREAQQALRRTIENYSQNCRFILSCNYSSKLIDPIISRCALFRFAPLQEKDIEEIIKNMSKNEKLKLDSNTIKLLYQISEGDVRKVQNILQSCASMSNKITEDLIYEIISVAQPKEILSIINLAVGGSFIKARDKLLSTMLKHGLSGIDVIKQIQKSIWQLDIKDEEKIKLIDKCGEIEFRLVEGSDEFLQLETLLASFYGKGK